MEFLDLCLKRESCRNYTGDSVPVDVLNKIAEAGRLSPSACNSQPWKFYIVTSGEALNETRKGVQVMGSNKFTEKAGAFIVILGGKESYSEKVGQVIFGRDFSNIDIGIAVAHMALEAASLGYGTCVLGSFSEKKVREAAKIEKSDKGAVKLVLAVGVPVKTEPKNKVRKSAEEIIKFVE